MKLKALDLFSGGGGASVGLHRAGFTVYGIDHLYHLEYPFLDRFRLSDVRYLSSEGISKFDFVWASPPCQKYSKLNSINLRSYPDLISMTRELLLSADVPFVIENVPSAPIRRDLMLCGAMFGLKVFRHRIFEIHGFTPPQPLHPKHAGRTGTHRCPYRPVNGYVQVTGNNFTLKQGQHAMGINWITDKKVLSQAVPPKYSEYIGANFSRRR